ncbi:MAG TPA: permease prefix domain 1-containing protein [Microbacteriaceae bacterium]|nr:permease prefix domain 1-containing protein [Microbacteriaceae bacterium]
MSTADYSNIHRYLDEAFAGITMTPEIQDLKEEIRGNLAARVNELVESGVDANTAARRAIDELGDIGELVTELDAGSADSGDSGADGTSTRPAGRPAATSHADAYAVYRVRPKPAFVVTVVIASVVTAGALALAALAATGVLPLPVGVIILLSGIAATGVALIVGDSLAHETTTNHPVPTNRAAGYFLASLLTVFGLEFGALVALGTLPVWTVVFAALGVVAGIVLFAFLGATQTNRKKQWVREAARQYQMDDRFTQDPVAAARFGIYTVVIWVLAFAAFIVLSITVGFAWSWLALLVGFAGFMFLLARMLFPSEKEGANKERS